MTKITPLDITAYHTEGTRFIALGDKINELVAALNSREEKKPTGVLQRKFCAERQLQRGTPSLNSGGA